jgi:hypothetical protein
MFLRSRRGMTGMVCSIIWIEVNTEFLLEDLKGRNNRHLWEDNIKRYLKQIACESIGWVNGMESSGRLL